MDFGLTDDQREIQRTARELLAERAKPERVREHAEAGTVDEALWRELSELGWAGIAIAEEHGGQGLGQIELSILCEELGALARARAVPRHRDGRDRDPAGRLRRAARALAAGARLRRDGRRARRRASDGTAELVIGGREAAVFVLIDEDGSGRIVSAEEAEVTPVDVGRPDPLDRARERPPAASRSATAAPAQASAARSSRSAPSSSACATARSR